MKATLLARVAPVLVLSGVLAGGVVVSGHAQTTSPQPGATTQPQAGAVPATGGTAATPGSAGAPQTGTAAPQTAPQPGATMAPQGNAPASTAEAAPPQTLSQMVEHRIADMHSRLQITHAQEAKWNRFAAVMRSNAKQLNAAYQRRAAKLGSMSALQNMETYAQIERSRVNDLERLVPAFRALYASLTPEQKHVADELFREHTHQHRQASTR